MLRADGLLGRVARASRRRPPLLRVRMPHRWATLLVAAGARRAPAPGGTAWSPGVRAYLHDEFGHRREAERLAERAAAAGDTSALRLLGEKRESEGRPAEADRLYRRAVRAGDRAALWSLACLREEAGDEAGAEELVERAAAVRDTTAPARLLMLRERLGRHASAERLAVRIARQDSRPLRWLANAREQHGRRADALRLYGLAADAGDLEAKRELIRLRERPPPG